LSQRALHKVVFEIFPEFIERRGLVGNQGVLELLDRGDLVSREKALEDVGDSKVLQKALSQQNVLKEDVGYWNVSPLFQRKTGKGKKKRRKRRRKRRRKSTGDQSKWRCSSLPPESGKWPEAALERMGRMIAANYQY